MFRAWQFERGIDNSVVRLSSPINVFCIEISRQTFYEYAREGIEVPRSTKITVYEIVFHRFEGDEVELEIHCSKGTYIRTIIDDLGEILGCGACDSCAVRVFPLSNG